MDTGPRQKRQHNPRQKANWFSVLTFGWTLETFKLGYTKDIKEDDLYAALPEHRSDELGSSMQRAWEKEVFSTQHCCVRSKPSLWIVLFKCFGCELVLYGLILAAMEFLIRLQQPLFLGLLLRYYSPVPASQNVTNSARYIGRVFNYYESEAAAVSRGEAIFFSCGVVFCSMVNIFVQHPYMMAVMHMGMKMRVGVCSLIYRKALKVSSQAMIAGQVVNLMANDVNRFDTGPLFIHYLWIGPLEMIFVTVYLYREMGMSAVYGALLIAAVVPFQTLLGSFTAHFRKNTAKRTDERVRLMNEIIMGIEVIKMYTWERPFQKIIDLARRHEIFYIKRTSYIRGIILSFIMFTSRLSIFLTILLYVTYIDHITAEKVFFVTCYYNIIKQTMTVYFPQAVGQVAEMHVAVQRIRDYLLSEESLRHIREEQTIRESSSSMASYISKGSKRVTIRPYTEDLKFVRTLSNESPSTSQAKPILKSVESTIAENSLLNSTGNSAIVFNNASCRWLKTSNKDDLLKLNFEVPPKSLTTLIGTVGSGKSSVLYMILEELPCTTGHVNIYGTVSYASQEPWLFAGSVRQNILFGEEFKKSRYMEVCKVCALERDISLFPHGDKTIVGERGVSLSGGQRARINLARAIYKQADIYLLDDPLSAVDTQVAKHLFEKCIKRFLADKTVVLVTHQLQFLKAADLIIILDNGEVCAQGSFNDLKASGLDIINLMVEKTIDLELPRHSHHELSRELDIPKVLQVMQSISRMSNINVGVRHYSMMLPSSLTVNGPIIEAEYQALGRVSGSVYQEYYLAGAPCFVASIVLLLFLLAQMCASSGDYWLSQWSSVEDKLTGYSITDDKIWSEGGFFRRDYVLVFAVITIGTIVMALVRAFVFFSLCMKSSIRLHDKMFQSISRSPMLFFQNNTTGRILNRFSKDMGAVDELLPQAMIDCFQIILNLIGVIIVILMVDLTLVIPVTAAIFIFYILRLIYIRTTGAVKRLEGITRSPVFGHLNATIMGLATIRTFNAEDILIMEFDRHQDLHSSAWYLFIASSRAFGFFLDVVCLLFIICVTFSSLLHTNVEGSSVGLAITQSISLTGIFQWGMRQSAEMENQMTSVERVLEYTKLPSEPELISVPEKAPPRDWPTQGRIEFQQLSLKYAQEGLNVLHNIDLVIQPQHKIGIVGRTGAGKSSIIQALFRLAILEGKIIIDGVDITEIGLHDLRAKVSIIPQEPVLFSGTMRKNLDPFDEYTDQELIEALEKVELKNAVHHDFGGLQRHISEGGTNFSVGQRQLVCLARAIVRNNKILILDEATANVDAQTDVLIQNAIRTNFADCTVLTIAHRLNTVVDSDKIMVLDAGRLMEYEHPHVLLKSKHSFFSKMVAETGPAMAKVLRQIALESYNSKEQDQH